MNRRKLVSRSKRALLIFAKWQQARKMGANFIWQLLNYSLAPTDDDEGPPTAAVRHEMDLIYAIIGFRPVVGPLEQESTADALLRKGAGP